jgi:hypothetical protein
MPVDALRASDAAWCVHGASHRSVEHRSCACHAHPKVPCTHPAEAELYMPRCTRAMRVPYRATLRMQCTARTAPAS